MCEGHFARLFSCFVLVRFDAEISTDMLESLFALLKSAIDRSEFIFAAYRPALLCSHIRRSWGQHDRSCKCRWLGIRGFELLTRDPAMMSSYSSSSFEPNSLPHDGPVCKYSVLLVAPVMLCPQH